MLVLTDMFGGTPANLAVTFVSPEVEVITGVNLPMLIKLARPQPGMDLLALAREMREHGRNAIWVASELLRGAEGMTGLRGHDHQPARPARARRGAVRPHGQRVSAPGPGRRAATQEMDGKSIMGLLLLAAAQGTSVTISADGADEIDGDRRAARAGRARLRRGAVHLKGLGVSPGIGIGRALVLKRSTRELRFQRAAGAGRRASSSGSSRRATRSREQIEQIKKRIAESAGAEHAYLFDAQLLMLDDPMLIDRAAAIVRDERLNAESALQRALDEISALLRPAPRIRTCASARATSPTSSAGCA